MSINILFGLMENVLQEGLIYGIMAMGVFITYKILDFPDLTVDGSFPLGACVAAALISAGVNPWLACLIAFLSGAAAGAVTGLLHVKLGITNLLSGILVMTALWSVNLIVINGSSVLAFFNQNTIFNSGPVSLLPDYLYQRRVVIMVILLAVLCKLVLDWYLNTQSGLLLRAAGDNGQFVTQLGRDQGKMKILGLAIGNGCTALSGCVLAQQSESANINMGKGMVVMALAAVIIGTSIFRRVSFMKYTTMALLGAIIYKLCLQVAMALHLPTDYLKLLMSVLLTIAIVSNKIGQKKGGAAGV